MIRYQFKGYYDGTCEVSEGGFETDWEAREAAEDWFMEQCCRDGSDPNEPSNPYKWEVARED